MRRTIPAETEMRLLQDELRASSTYVHFLIADLRTHLARKAYHPDQPRDDHGRWTSGGGSSGNTDPSARTARVRVADNSGDWPRHAYGTEYSPDLRGWHDYVSGPNIVCTADQRCTRDEIADQLSRFAVPGQDPRTPVTDRSTNWVFVPGTILPAGQVQTTILNGGLTVKNQTYVDHVLYDGVAVRTVNQNPDGSWSVTTHGYGNNLIPGMELLNQEFGPSIFNKVDDQMRDNIARHHGTQKSTARLIHIARSGRCIYPGQPLRVRPSTGGLSHDIA